MFKSHPLASSWIGVLLLLTGCGGAESLCDSSDTRSSVVKIISGDSNNPLISYALKNSSSVAAAVSNTSTEAEKLSVRENARKDATYKLDDRILTNSRNRAMGTYTCSGLLDVTVGDTTAQKQVDFEIERTIEGKISISVNPFVF